MRLFHALSLTVLQTLLQELHDPLRAAGILVHKVGGADYAGELDAKRAIDQVRPMYTLL